MPSEFEGPTISPGPHKVQAAVELYKYGFVNHDFGMIFLTHKPLHRMIVVGIPWAQTQFLLKCERCIDFATKPS